MTDRSLLGLLRKTAAAIRLPLRKHPYRAPIIVTCAALIAVAGVYTTADRYVEAHTNTYYQVLLGNEVVGDVSTPDLVDAVVAKKAAELEDSDSKVRYKLDDNQVRYEQTSAYKTVPDDAATLALVEKQLKTHPVGVKLIVDGKAIAVVRDQETADQILQRVKDKYVPPAKKKEATVRTLSASTLPAKTGDKQSTVGNVSFEEKVTTEEATLSDAQVADPDQLYKKLVLGSTTKRIYTVKKGDCVGCIAQSQKVSSALIYQNNPWIEDDEIKAGDTLDLTVQEPILNVRSDERVTEIEEIDPPVEIRKTDAMKAGQSKTLREGTPGKRLVTYQLLKRNGSVIEEERVSAEVLTKPISTVILKGTKVTPSEGTGHLRWPVSNHRITSYMGKRWGRMHKGMDIVGNKTIMAADNGVVESAGTGINGLGNSIVINHNDGTKTIYGHLSKISVKKGQVVAQGDAIGIMGNTGHSFGTHLHFEVYVNGKLKNPIDYL